MTWSRTPASSMESNRRNSGLSRHQRDLATKHKGIKIHAFSLAPASQWGQPNVAPSSWAPSTTPTASSSCAAIRTTRSLPPGTLERGSSPRTKSATSSAGSSEAGPSYENRCQTELGWGAPACARRVSGLDEPDGVRAGACAPARIAPKERVVASRDPVL